MPSAAASLSSSTWNSRPVSRASAWARAAISVGVSRLLGSFARSRARLAASPRMTPRRTPSAIAAASVPSTRAPLIDLGASAGCRWRSKR